MKEEAGQGLVTQPKQAVVITLDDEEEMWRSGALGQSNPAQLLRTLIYHLGIHCSLRAAQEHRDLEFGKLFSVVINNITVVIFIKANPLN